MVPPLLRRVWLRLEQVRFSCFYGEVRTEG